MDIEILNNDIKNITVKLGVLLRQHELRLAKKQETSAYQFIAFIEQLDILTRYLSAFKEHLAAQPFEGHNEN